MCPDFSYFSSIVYFASLLTAIAIGSLCKSKYHYCINNKYLLYSIYSAKEVRAIKLLQILVVNKPASIPIHTTGRYRHNTLLKHLERKQGQKLYTCHRLDRLTSGIIVLLKNPQKAKDYGALVSLTQLSACFLSIVGVFLGYNVIC